MKKFLLALGIIIVVTIVAAYLFRQPLMMALVGSQIKPEQAFSADSVPAAPDYSSDQNWASLPNLADPADELPEGVKPRPTDVAVFFVHPTSFISKSGWNQPLSDEDANWVVDQRILRHQASVFNGCCDVFAPRYRQATFFAFLDESDSSTQALNLAYADVDRAFSEFLTRIGPARPFIIAGHSQGTRHATQLLASRIADTALLNRMVAAYLIGFSVSHEQLGEVPACDTPTDTQCAIGWNAIDGRGSGAFGDTQNLLCTNPLTWRVDNEYADNSLNTGGIGYPTYGRAEPDEDVTAMNVEVGVADAQCEGGQLAVHNLKSEAFPSRMLGNSMHIYDYSLFHMNMRSNLQERIAAFLGR
ncbi:MAG: DUF3089 domain-containing protein [Pseudomonadaceae bacterium]|nr:DUF3089 domain-containing protein [Pseudomonadaceae bacterium]